MYWYPECSFLQRLTQLIVFVVVHRLKYSERNTLQQHFFPKTLEVRWRRREMYQWIVSALDLLNL